MSDLTNRCSWLTKDEIYIEYHDNQWGVPVYDDALLFEMLILESFHTGLSWLLILKKRSNFQRAFDNFDAEKMAKYDETKINQLLNDEGIVRNKLKINGAVTNAKVYLEIKKEWGSFSDYIWSFSNNQIIYNRDNTQEDLFALATRVTKDMKKRGMKFVGAVTIQSYLEAVGIINNHDVNCDLHCK